MSRGRLLMLGALVAACAAEELPGDPLQDAPAGPVLERAWTPPDGACDLDPADPTALLVTTTDFSTGAVSRLDLASLEVTPDVTAASTDAIPYAVGGRVVVVNRHGFDYLDVLDPADQSPRGQLSVLDETAGPNLHALAIDPGGTAWVTALQSRFVGLVDLDAPPSQAPQGRVDLAAFADDDGVPEASVAVACGSTLYVGVQRLAPGFVPVGPDALVPIDTDERLPVDIDPQTEGAQGLALSGSWLKQLRRDPADPTGTSLLALTTGIERIDLARGEVTWAVPEATFASIGIAQRELPQAFDVTDDGTQAFVAAYDEDFTQVRLYRIGLDGAAPTQPEEVAAGFDSAERTLEVVGDTLVYGSRRLDAPGLWVFTLDLEDPQAPLDVRAGPLATGLAPYSMVAIP